MMDMSDFVTATREHDKQWGFSNEDTVENLLHVGLAICEEAGEVGGAIKKYVRALDPHNKAEWGDRNRLREVVSTEMVDVLIYMTKLMLILDIDGYNFEQAWHAKHQVLHERWGPASSHGQMNCDVCPQPDKASSTLEPALDLAVTTYFDKLQRQTRARLEMGEREYKGKWKGLTIPELVVMREEEDLDAHAYQAMIEYKETYS